MRVAPLFVLAAALTFAAAAQAQTAPAAQAPAGTTQATAPASKSTAASRKRTKIDITKRSPLDAGTTVKPGSKSYLDYALPADYNFPTYGAGASGGIVPGRYPLPDRWYLPGY